MPTDFQGKVALVTGGGAGIGEACCRRLAAGGASVAVADRDQAAAERVAGQLESAMVVDVDVSDPAAVDAMVTSVLERFDRLDVAVEQRRHRWAAGADHRTDPRFLARGACRQPRRGLLLPSG